MSYRTYIFGNDAMVSPIKVPKDWTKNMAKIKTIKFTVKERINHLNKLVADQQESIENLQKQLGEQNVLIDRARYEGNQLIEKYNKLAGKFNSIRTLVTTND